MLARPPALIPPWVGSTNSAISKKRYDLLLSGELAGKLYVVGGAYEADWHQSYKKLHMFAFFSFYHIQSAY